MRPVDGTSRSHRPANEAREPAATTYAVFMCCTLQTHLRQYHWNWSLDSSEVMHQTASEHANSRTILAVIDCVQIGPLRQVPRRSLTSAQLQEKRHKGQCQGINSPNRCNWSHSNFEGLSLAGSLRCDEKSHNSNASSENNKDDFYKGFEQVIVIRRYKKNCFLNHR